MQLCLPRQSKLKRFTWVFDERKLEERRHVVLCWSKGDWKDELCNFPLRKKRRLHVLENLRISWMLQASRKIEQKNVFGETDFGVTGLGNCTSNSFSNIIYNQLLYNYFKTWNCYFTPIFYMGKENIYISRVFYTKIACSKFISS